MPISATQGTTQAQAHHERSGNIRVLDQESDEKWSIRVRDGEVFNQPSRGEVVGAMLVQQKCIARHLCHDNRRNQRDGDIIAVRLFRVRGHDTARFPTGIAISRTG